MSSEEEIQAAQVTNEEYKIWKKNAPFLYDMVVTHALEWPSLTCQWFPDRERPAGKDYTSHRLLLGTHTSGQDQNYVQIAQVHLPNQDVEVDSSKYDEDRGEIGSYGGANARIQIVQQINHDGELNRARYCPQNCDLIATRTVMGETYIFDRTKHSLQPNADGKCRPDIVCKGQTGEGYGLAWSPLVQGHLIAASEDETVCEWDVNQYKKIDKAINPLKVYRGHTSVVEDVAWHAHHESLFASVGDDKLLLIWDSRESGDAPKHRVTAHDGEINAVLFSPANEYLICTGSSDKTVGLWDMRNTKTRLHSLEAHTDEVLQLAWSPHNETILASAAADRRVNVWDLSRIGEEQTPDDAEDGPPELLFVHGGHTARTTDICWSPQEDWHMATVSEDNVLQVFRPSTTALGQDEDDVGQDELE
ncbi:nucleosome remodeling subunit caf1 nurf55 msi1 [Ceraceosorus bombacis]|uniref:Nucleosome remodeling subunit caf1 nurf55 msi1 n=1 Tax=Ceraceosorus bombacis TaxID=401625 RepID=A0A0P1BDF0_9BASI|nr:nucleosome remodeling subunit caf1 nurf55 msi1 [Ceraceosorus bombacis]